MKKLTIPAFICAALTANSAFAYSFVDCMSGYHLDPGAMQMLAEVCKKSVEHVAREDCPR